MLRSPWITQVMQLSSMCCSTLVTQWQHRLAALDSHTLVPLPFLHTCAGRFTHQQQHSQPEQQGDCRHCSPHAQRLALKVLVGQEPCSGQQQGQQFAVKLLSTWRCPTTANHTPLKNTRPAMQSGCNCAYKSAYTARLLLCPAFTTATPLLLLPHHEWEARVLLHTSPVSHTLSAATAAAAMQCTCATHKQQQLHSIHPAHHLPKVRRDMRLRPSAKRRNWMLPPVSCNTRSGDARNIGWHARACIQRGGSHTHLDKTGCMWLKVALRCLMGRCKGGDTVAGRLEYRRARTPRCRCHKARGLLDMTIATMQRHVLHKPFLVAATTTFSTLSVARRATFSIPLVLWQEGPELIRRPTLHQSPVRMLHML